MKRHLLIPFLLLVGALLGVSARAAPFVQSEDVYKAGKGQPTAAACTYRAPGSTVDLPAPGTIKPVTGGIVLRCDLAAYAKTYASTQGALVSMTGSTAAGTSAPYWCNLRLSDPYSWTAYQNMGLASVNLTCPKAASAPVVTPPVGAPPATDPPASGSVVYTWTQIATERAPAFTVTGTKVVRFGLDPNWIEKTVTGAGECSFDWFGGDPAPGRGKACEVRAP